MPLSEQTLHERMDKQFTDIHRTRSAISIAVDRLWRLDYDDPDFDLDGEVQLVIDTLITINHSLESIASDVEKITLGFGRSAPRAAPAPEPSPLEPPRLVVDNTQRTQTEENAHT